MQNRIKGQDGDLLGGRREVDGGPGWGRGSGGGWFGEMCGMVSGCVLWVVREGGGKPLTWLLRGGRTLGPLICLVPADPFSLR